MVSMKFARETFAASDRVRVHCACSCVWPRLTPPLYFRHFYLSPRWPLKRGLTVIMSRVITIGNLVLKAFPKPGKMPWGRGWTKHCIYRDKYCIYKLHINYLQKFPYNIIHNLHLAYDPRCFANQGRVALLRSFTASKNTLLFTLASVTLVNTLVRLSSGFLRTLKQVAGGCSKCLWFQSCV